MVCFKFGNLMLVNIKWFDCDFIRGKFMNYKNEKKKRLIMLIYDYFKKYNINYFG